MIDSQWRSWNHYSAIGPDPRADTSRLRMRSRGKGCLVPGATFVGTQRSGRSTYEVGVQIVNVDLEASHLCGYLNIRGLTEDWPELTTFFDAEIIGDRHSFVTNKWGAKEANDMTHWARFSPFRSLRNKLDKTGLFDHMTKPYVFMRWKERFLVPDHRVRDIHGASFAGFYYVCVELGESSTSAARASAAALAASSDVTQQDFAGFTSESDANSTQRRRGQTTLGGSAMMLDEDDEEEVEADPNFDALSRPAREPLVPGRMTGFYYHANSEPYQQLALQHVPEPSSGTFEMR
ncbi:hypothetical protein IE81DRAFT_333295 [Ceraceosorus guamensis]|uniref:Vacuolar import and degradation protein n=1 Tax=Ceraceosorus guamensis TaxID=1522189 RepID=A0A316W728_9BASI|nr:hypothetical protein IE81DRAFT_333295 [Ceraceosorus guamensis]PWN45414.1 hypothetical protein IE81DRAFT_333295 [Ceraceosorus guamensis]